MRWSERLWNWLGGIYRHLQAPKPTAPITAVLVEDLPETLDHDQLYLVGNQEGAAFAAMRCPCDCGAALHMNLSHGVYPLWTLTTHENGAISLSPSIWRTVGCQSHFFLRRGSVVWCTVPSSTMSWFDAIFSRTSGDRPRRHQDREA